MKKILKQTLKHLFSFPLNVLAAAFPVAWIFGVFSCAAADFDDQKPEYANDSAKVFNFYPSVAQGHEQIYDRFLKGKLVYRPNPYSDEGRVELRIANLDNPLESTFDLSRCGDMGEYLSISTGYRKGKKAENKGKVEIWLAPRFLIEKKLKTTAKHFQPIFDSWNETAEVGIFWSWWANALFDFDYLTKENMEDLSKSNLYKKWKGASSERGEVTFVLWGRRKCAENFMFIFPDN